MDKRAFAGAVAVAAVLVTGGCSKVADKAADKAAEKAIESASGGKAKVDDGKVTVEDGKGNKVEIDENGVKTSGKDGTSSATYGDDAKLPDGWPKELAPPKGTKIVASSSTESAGGKQMLVTGLIEGDVKDVYQGLLDQIQGAGYSIDSKNYLESSTGDLGTVQASNNDDTVTASVAAATGSDSGKTSVTMTVTPAT